MLNYPLSHIDTSIIIFPSLNGSNAESAALHTSSWHFSQIVYWLQNRLPNIAIFPCILLIINFFSCCILCVTPFEGHSRVLFCFRCLLIIIIFELYIHHVLYGATAFLGTTSAYIYCRRYAQCKHVIRFLLGLMLLILSCQVRASSIIGIMPYLTAILAYDLFTKGKIRNLLLYSITSAIIVLSFQSSASFPKTQIWSTSSPLQDAYRISTIRSKFCDFKDCSGQDKTQLYRTISVSKNDIQLMERSCFIHPSRENERWLQQLEETRIKDNENIPTSLQLIKRRLASFRHWHLIIPSYVLSMLLCWYLFRHGKQFRPILIIFALNASIFLLILYGRFACSAPHSMFISASILILFFIRGRIIPRIADHILAISTIIGGVPLFIFLLSYNSSHAYLPLKSYYSSLYTECRSNPRNIYFTCDIFSNIWWNSNPRLSPFVKDYNTVPNLFTLSSWLCTMPSFNHKISQYIATTPSMDFTAPNVYFIASSKHELEPIRRYIEEHSGKSVEICETARIENNGIYHLTSLQ